VEEFKVVKARLVLSLRDSKDEKISQAGIETRSGRKWSASSAVESAESRIRHKEIESTVVDQVGHPKEKAELEGCLEIGAPGYSVPVALSIRCPAYPNQHLKMGTGNSNCKLCDKPGNLEHVLSSCSVSLGQVW
jgi:hypothetical protein